MQTQVLMLSHYRIVTFSCLHNKNCNTNKNNQIAQSHFLSNDFLCRFELLSSANSMTEVLIMVRRKYLYKNENLNFERKTKNKNANKILHLDNNNK